MDLGQEKVNMMEGTWRNGSKQEKLKSMNTYTNVLHIRDHVEPKAAIQSKDQGDDRLDAEECDAMFF